MGAAPVSNFSLFILLAASIAAEGPKREKPGMLAPEEFHTAVIRAGIKSHMLSPDNQHIMARFGRPKPGHGFIPVDQLARRSDVRLVDKMLPIRMAVISASFPNKKQLQEFQRALHLGTLEEAQKESHFAGLEIERRPMRPDGKPAGKWDKASIQENYSELARVSGQRYAEEVRSLKPVIVPGLVVGLPERLDGIRYPRPDQGLRLITKSLEKIGSTRQKTPHDANDENPFEQKTGKETKKPDASAIPEHCLVRFVDAEVEPGQAYEYRFQVRMRNPNFKRNQDVASPELAKSEQLVSEWVYVPGQIAIAPDFAFYAVDQQELEPSRFAQAKAPDRNQSVVQLQRWVDWCDLTGHKEPVGDWAIAERVLVRAGEYIGGTHVVELPVWNWLEERFVLASSPEDRQNKRIELPFTDEQEIAPLLVSSSGGEVEFKRIKERVPRELLVLMPNGRLTVRNSAKDELDPDRRDHYRHWRGRVDQIKRAASGQKLGSGVFSRSESD